MSAGVSITLGRLADALGASLKGDAERAVTGVAPLEAAGPAQVSFVTDSTYLRRAASSRAGAFLVSRDVSGLPGALLRVDQPQQELIPLLELFHPDLVQVGGLRIEDDVEIGVNTASDRATLGGTVVRPGTKIDNLLQIGHNCDMSEDMILVSQIGIAGSSRIGNRAILAGQGGVSDHVTVGAGAILTAKSGVPNDVPAGEIWSGIPSRPASEQKRILAGESQLPELIRRALEKRLHELEERRA